MGNRIKVIEQVYTTHKIINPLEITPEILPGDTSALCTWVPAVTKKAPQVQLRIPVTWRHGGNRFPQHYKTDRRLNFRGSLENSASATKKAVLLSLWKHPHENIGGGVQDRKICIITTFFSPHTFLTGSPHSAGPWAPAHTGAAPGWAQLWLTTVGGAGTHLTCGYQSHLCKPTLTRTSTSPRPGEDPAFPNERALQEGTCPSGRPLAPKGSPAQAQGWRAFSFFLFSYFCINFLFSWLFSVHWPLEFGFFDSWRDAQKTHSASKEIHNLAFKGNSIKWYSYNLILYLTSELSSHLLPPKWLNKESSKERFKGTVGKRKPAPHPTFLPIQSRRLSAEGEIYTQTLWKGRNET